ncbi:MAG: tryptophan synthase subunit alpha [Lachnospiraceae bacterium]|nr:tryptophan synthase subunit alpha [Lachnospiraceae bacterium]
MNRIEARLQQVQAKGEKAFVTYITAGLPDMEGCAKLIKAQEEAGLDVLELGIPFSDPVADGPTIQAASYKSIQQGTNLKKVFDMVEKLRGEKCELPIVFMMYFNTVLYYGLEAFAARCAEAGVDGVIIPDLPYEEQEQLQSILDKTENAPILLQLITPVSRQRIPMLVEKARGFVYCISSMGVTGQSADFHKDVVTYLQDVKKVSKVPVMLGFGIRTAQDVSSLKDTIDGCIVGSHLIKMMEESNYDLEKAKDYIRTFKKELNA